MTIKKALITERHAVNKNFAAGPIPAKHQLAKKLFPHLIYGHEETEYSSTLH